MTEWEAEEFISLSVYAPPKFGKSHFADMFVDKFDGMVFDFAKVNRVVAPKVANGPKPRYELVVDGLRNVGDAYTAFKHVGLNPVTQYRYIKSWDEFMFAIEEAKMYRDSSKKANRRVWVVIDDTTNMRWQNVLWTLNQTKHTSPSTADWTMSNLEMLSAYSILDANFNTIYVNQVKDEYVDDKPTGNLIGEFYPKNLGHIVDVSLNYTSKLDEEGEEYAVLKVDALRNRHRFAKKSRLKEMEFKDIDTLTPQYVLTALEYDEAIW